MTSEGVYPTTHGGSTRERNARYDDFSLVVQPPRPMSGTKVHPVRIFFSSPFSVFTSFTSACSWSVPTGRIATPFKYTP